MKWLALLLLSFSCRAAVIFDGTDDFLICHGPLGSVVPLGNPAQDKSIGLWFKRYNTNSCSLMAEQHVTLGNTFIALRFNQLFTNRFEYFYHRNSDGAEELWASEPGIGSITNVWTHLILVHNHNDSNSVKLIINGVLKTGAWRAGSTHGAQASSYPMRIGSGFTTNFFFGELDEFFWLHNTLLSDMQSRLIYQSRIRGIARFVYAAEANGVGNLFGNGRAVCNPFDGHPDGGAVGFLRDTGDYAMLRSGASNTNLVLFESRNGPVSRAGSVATYLPNE